MVREDRAIGPSTYLFGGASGLRGREFVDLSAHGEISQLVSTVEYMVADGEVDEGGQKDARPDGDVIREDTEGVVGVCNPTPELWEKIWLASWHW